MSQARHVAVAGPRLQSRGGDPLVEQLRLMQRQCRVVSVSVTNGGLDAADGADDPSEEIGAPAPRPCLS